MPTRKTNPNENLTSIDLALNLLELFSVQNPELGISDMADAIGKKPGTLHRTIMVLKERGYVDQPQKRGKYRLGLKAFELGCVYQNQSDVLKDAMQYLERLAKATNETVNLAVLDQNLKEVVYISKIDSQHVLKTDIQIGTKLLAHCTALGKVLLAGLDETVLCDLYPPHASLPTYTSGSVSNTDQLGPVLEEVHKTGFAYDLEEFRPGVICVARPFRDMHNRTIAAISVTVPAIRCAPDRLEQIKKIMLNEIQP